MIHFSPRNGRTVLVIAIAIGVIASARWAGVRFSGQLTDPPFCNALGVAQCPISGSRPECASTPGLVSCVGGDLICTDNSGMPIDASPICCLVRMCPTPSCSNPTMGYDENGCSGCPSCMGNQSSASGGSSAGNTSSQCLGTCGDGIIIRPEECDDKNNAPNDGCSPDCKKEGGASSKSSSGGSGGSGGSASGSGGSASGSGGSASSSGGSASGSGGSQSGSGGSGSSRSGSGGSQSGSGGSGSSKSGSGGSGSSRSGSGGSGSGGSQSGSGGSGSSRSGSGGSGSSRSGSGGSGSSRTGSVGSSSARSGSAGSGSSRSGSGGSQSGIGGSGSSHSGSSRNGSDGSGSSKSGRSNSNSNSGSSRSGFGGSQSGAGVSRSGGGQNTSSRIGGGTAGDSPFYPSPFDSGPIFCGNKKIEHGESCDDGNQTDGDGCSKNCDHENGSECLKNAQCKSGVCANGQCVPCASDADCGIGKCVEGICVGQCGNGVIEAREECDAGDVNSDAQPNRCRSDCSRPWCGDGVVDSGESCDDGNARPYDGCDQTCTSVQSSVVDALPVIGNPLVANLVDTDTQCRANEDCVSGLCVNGDCVDVQKQVEVIATGRPPSGETGPVAVAVMAAGAATGFAFMRRKRHLP